MIMTPQQKLQLLLTLDKAIWSCQWQNLGSAEASQKDFEARLQRCGVKSQFVPNGVVFARHFKGTLTGFDFELNEAPGIVRLIRLLQQNPNKTDMYGRLSQYAILARGGNHICWVIDRASNKFLGRIQDGKFIKNEPRAYNQNNAAAAKQTSFTGSQGYNPGQGTNFSNLPDIEPQEIPSEVMAYNFETFDADDDSVPDGFEMPWVQ